MGSGRSQPGDPRGDTAIAIADLHFLAVLEAAVRTLESAGYGVGQIVLALEGTLPDGDPFRVTKGTPAEQIAEVAELAVWAAQTLLHNPAPDAASNN